MERVATQYQEDLPVVRPVVRRFDIEVGHCAQCRRHIQGRHALQTSDALGAAGVQLGPEVAALVVQNAHADGHAAGEVSDLLGTRFGLPVTPGISRICCIAPPVMRRRPTPNCAGRYEKAAATAAIVAQTVTAMVRCPNFMPSGRSREASP